MSWRTVLLLGVLLLPWNAWAVLGGQSNSVTSDQTSMNASVRTSVAQAAYRVQSFQTTTGITVKEYIGVDGTVFALSWQGPIMPDLKQLLGQYFSDYVNAARNRRGGRHHLSIKQAGLVVQAQGRLRAFSGIAYLPAKMPAGVSPDALQ